MLDAVSSAPLCERCNALSVFPLSAACCTVSFDFLHKGKVGPLVLTRPYRDSTAVDVFFLTSDHRKGSVPGTKVRRWGVGWRGGGVWGVGGRGFASPAAWLNFFNMR